VLSNPDNLPPHVEETVRAVEALHREHRDAATPLQRSLETLRSQLSAPGFVVFGLAMVLLWLALNQILPARLKWDPWPFPVLSLVLSGLAFLTTLLILATQQRADALAGHREQLILQLAFVSERKTAKVIALLEEQRKDSPQLQDREDVEAEQMKETVDPRAVSEAVRDASP